MNRGYIFALLVFLAACMLGAASFYVLPQLDIDAEKFSPDMLAFGLAGTLVIIGLMFVVISVDEPPIGGGHGRH